MHELDSPPSASRQVHFKNPNKVKLTLAERRKHLLQKHKTLRQNVAKTFRRRSALARARLWAPVLYDAYSYKCSACNVKLRSQTARAVHKIRRHSGKSWRCGFCKHMFRRRPELVAHLETYHKTNKEEIEMLGILRNANILRNVKKPTRTLTPLPITPPPPKRPIAESEEEEEEEDDEEDDEEEDYDDVENAIAPIPVQNISIGATPVPVNVAGLVQQPADMAAAQPVVSGSPAPLKYVFDECMFDPVSLTCLACPKSFKTMRAFKLHKDRHQGTLNHKCPECVKTFNGRSEVNRHMLAIHNRELRDTENTQQNVSEIRAKNAVVSTVKQPQQPFDVVGSFSLPPELTGSDEAAPVAPNVVPFTAAAPYPISAATAALQHQQQSDNSSASASRCSTSLSDRGSISLEPGFDIMSYVEDPATANKQEDNAAEVEAKKSALIEQMMQKAKKPKKAKKDKSKKDRHSRESLDKDEGAKVPKLSGMPKVKQQEEADKKPEEATPRPPQEIPSAQLPPLAPPAPASGSAPVALPAPPDRRQSVSDVVAPILSTLQPHVEAPAISADDEAMISATVENMAAGGGATNEDMPDLFDMPVLLEDEEKEEEEEGEAEAEGEGEDIKGDVGKDTVEDMTDDTKEADDVPNVVTQSDETSELGRPQQPPNPSLESEKVEPETRKELPPQVHPNEEKEQPELKTSPETLPGEKPVKPAVKETETKEFRAENDADASKTSVIENPDMEDIEALVNEDTARMAASLAGKGSDEEPSASILTADVKAPERESIEETKESSDSAVVVTKKSVLPAPVHDLKPPSPIPLATPSPNDKIASVEEPKIDKAEELESKEKAANDAKSDEKDSKGDGAGDDGREENVTPPRRSTRARKPKQLDDSNERKDTVEATTERDLEKEGKVEKVEDHPVISDAEELATTLENSQVSTPRDVGEGKEQPEIAPETPKADTESEDKPRRRKGRPRKSGDAPLKSETEEKPVAEEATPVLDDSQSTCQINPPPPATTPPPLPSAVSTKIPTTETSSWKLKTESVSVDSKNRRKGRPSRIWYPTPPPIAATEVKLQNVSVASSTEEAQDREKKWTEIESESVGARPSAKSEETLGGEKIENQSDPRVTPGGTCRPIPKQDQPEESQEDETCAKKELNKSGGLSTSSKTEARAEIPTEVGLQKVPVENEEQTEPKSNADDFPTIRKGKLSKSTKADQIEQPDVIQEEMESKNESAKPENHTTKAENIRTLRRLRQTKSSKSEEPNEAQESDKLEAKSKQVPNVAPQVEAPSAKRGKMPKANKAAEHQESQEHPKVEAESVEQKETKPMVEDAVEAGQDMLTRVVMVEEQVEPGNLKNVPKEVEDEINEQSMKSEQSKDIEVALKGPETEKSEHREEEESSKVGNRPVRRVRQSKATKTTNDAIVPEKVKAKASEASEAIKAKTSKKPSPTVKASSSSSSVVSSSSLSKAPRGPEMSIMAFMKKKKEDAMNKSAEKARTVRRGRPPKNNLSTGHEKPKKVSDETKKRVITDGQDDKEVARQSRLSKNAKGKDSADPVSLLNVPKKAEIKSDEQAKKTPKTEQAVRRGRPPKSRKAEERIEPSITTPPNEAEKPRKGEGRTKSRGNSEAKSEGKKEDSVSKPLDEIRQTPTRTRRKAAAAAVSKNEGDAKLSKVVVPESAAREETPDAISPKRRGRPRKSSGQEEAAAQTTPEKSPRPNRSATPVTEEAAAPAAAAEGDVATAEVSSLDLKLQTPSKAKVVLHVMSDSDIEKKMSPPKAEPAEEGATTATTTRGKKRARKSSERSSEMSDPPAASDDGGLRTMRARQPRKEEAGQQDPHPTPPSSLPPVPAADAAPAAKAKSPASSRRRPKRASQEADVIAVAKDAAEKADPTAAPETKPEAAEAVTTPKTSPEKPLPTETSELMKRKGVTLSKDGKRLMIPSQKLSLPPELCRTVTGEGDKKQKFQCQICQKAFLRKDKVNYHVYSEHREEFVRMGGQGMPKILKKPEEEAVAVAVAVAGERKKAKAEGYSSGAGKEMRAMGRAIGKKLIAKSKRMVMAATKRKKEDNTNKSGAEAEMPRVTRQKSQVVQEEKVPQKLEETENPTPETTPIATVTADETLQDVTARRSPSPPLSPPSPPPPPPPAPVDLNKTCPELAALDTSVKDLNSAISRLLAVRRENGRRTRLVSSPQGKSALKSVRRLAKGKREKRYSLFSYPTLLRLKRLKRERPRFDVRAVDEKKPLVVTISRQKLPGELERLRPRTTKKSPEEKNGAAKAETATVETETPTAAADASKKRGRPRKLGEETPAMETAKPEAAAPKEKLPTERSAVTAAAEKESGDSAEVTADQKHQKSEMETVTSRPRRGNVTAAAGDCDAEVQLPQEPTGQKAGRGRPRRLDPLVANPEKTVEVEKAVQKEEIPAKAEAAPEGVVVTPERKGRGRPKKTEPVAGAIPSPAESAAVPPAEKRSRGRPKGESDKVPSPSRETPPPEKRSTRPKPKPGELAEDKMEAKANDAAAAVDDGDEEDEPLRPKRSRSKSGDKKRDSGAASDAPSPPTKRRRPTGEDERRRSPDKQISSPPPPLNPCTLKIKISPNPELASRTSPGSPTKTPEGKENTGIKLVLKASGSSLVASVAPATEVAEISVVAQAEESSTGAESNQKYVVRSSGDNPLKLKVKKKKKKKEKDKERKETNTKEGEVKAPLKLTLKLPSQKDGGALLKKHKRKKPKENLEEEARGESSQKQKQPETEPKPEQQQKSFKLRIKSPHRLLEQAPPPASTSDPGSAKPSQSSSSGSRQQPPKENVQLRQQQLQKPKLPPPTPPPASLSGSSRSVGKDSGGGDSSHVPAVGRRSGSCVDTTAASSTSAASNRETGKSKFDRLQQQQSHQQHGRGAGQPQRAQQQYHHQQQAGPSHYPHYPQQQPQHQQPHAYNNPLGAWQQQQQQEYFDKMLMHASGRYSSSSYMAAAVADNAAAMAAAAAAAMTQLQQQQQQQQPFDNNIQDAAMAAMMMMTAAGTSSAVGMTAAPAAPQGPLLPSLHQPPVQQPQPQVTFSPDSSPEHVGEGMASFSNLLSVIDRSDEAAAAVGAGTSGGQRRQPPTTEDVMQQGQSGDSAIVPRRATSGNRLKIVRFLPCTVRRKGVGNGSQKNGCSRSKGSAPQKCKI